MGVEASSPRLPKNRQCSGTQDALISPGPKVPPVSIPKFFAPSHQLSRLRVSESIKLVVSPRSASAEEVQNPPNLTVRTPADRSIDPATVFRIPGIFPVIPEHPSHVSRLFSSAVSFLPTYLLFWFHFSSLRSPMISFVGSPP